MSVVLEPTQFKIPRRIPWLSDLPLNWKLARGKALFTRVQRVVRSEDEVVTAFRDGEVTLRKNRRKVGFTESLKEIGYQGIRKGDLVIHAMDGFAGAIGVSDSDGKSSPVYQVCLPRNQEVNPFFYAYLLREMARSEFILALATGIRERSTDFRYDDFATQLYPVPPRAQQDALVAFLDRKLEEIDRFIANKLRLIELLEEDFQRVVDHVACFGICESTDVADSEKDSIRSVPGHWTALPLKYAFSSIEYGISDSGSDEGTIPVLTMGHIQSGRVTVPESGGVLQVDPNMLLRHGDLLFNRTNSAELVGKVGLFEDCGGDVTFASYLVRLRPKPNVDSRFMNYLLNSPKMLRLARQHAIPSLHQANLNPTRYGRLHIALPPYDEQLEITEWLSERQEIFDSTTKRVEREIELMSEFRTSLIAEAVTGKIDVRSFASN